MRGCHIGIDFSFHLEVDIQRQKFHSPSLINIMPHTSADGAGLPTPLCCSGQDDYQSTMMKRSHDDSCNLKILRILQILFMPACLSRLLEICLFQLLHMMLEVPLGAPTRWLGQECGAKRQNAMIVAYTHILCRCT